MKTSLAVTLLIGLLLIVPNQVSFAKQLHGTTARGELELPTNFPHFNYVNPNAPKGGKIILEATGSYDSLNPFIIRGDIASSLGLTLDTLLKSNGDETSAYYAYLAEWVDISEDGLSIKYKIRDIARFHDGSKITAEDMVWTFNQLRENGAPQYQFYYGDVQEAVALEDNIIDFRLIRANPEMALILGQLPVLSKKDWENKDFTKTTLTPMLTSGPYKIGAFEVGKFMEFERVKDYWGEALPVNIGENNYDTIRYEYYRDRTISREAFKAGKLDFWAENSAKSWATAFDMDAVKEGKIIKKEFNHNRVAPMQGFAFNLRKPLFADIKLREALSYAWDYEWVNQTIMYNAYSRTRSFFDNSPLAATGLPSDEELEILNPYKQDLPERVFTTEYQPPKSDGLGQNRDNLRIAAMMLKDAGWAMKDGLLTNNQTGLKLEFELLLSSDALVPHSQALIRGIERLGGKVELRVIDSAQYVERINNHDFDMIIHTVAQSNSPGNEQREYWGSQSADMAGGRNVFGFKNSAVDQIIEDLIIAKDNKELETYTHALDRILQWSFIMIPQFYSATDRVAWWDKFGMPDKTPESGVDKMLWWLK